MISILIATMGRPSLAATLQSLALARVPAGEDVEVVIADDSPNGQVAAIVGKLALSLMIRIISVGQQNVAAARNACLDAASGDWLIFVDDDEVVENDWLEGHLSAGRDFTADVVLGPVFPRYPDRMPGWLKAADPLFQDWGWNDDGKVSWRGRTGNTLVRRAALPDELRFDPAFGRTGGEDHDFFLRLAATGAKMVVTNRARVHEDVPPERATSAYALRRAVRTGQIYARLCLRDRRAGFRITFAAGAIIKLAVGTILGLILRPFDRARSFRLEMRAATNLGKLREIFGARLMAAWAEDRA